MIRLPQRPASALSAMVRGTWTRLVRCSDAISLLLQHTPLPLPHTSLRRPLGIPYRRDGTSGKAGLAARLLVAAAHQPLTDRILHVGTGVGAEVCHRRSGCYEIGPGPKHHKWFSAVNSTLTTAACAASRTTTGRRRASKLTRFRQVTQSHTQMASCDVVNANVDAQHK